MISCNWREVLEPADYVRSGAMLVAFLATAFGSAETWIQADTLSMAVFGAGWVLFPQQLLSMQTDVKLNYLHTVFGQSIGAIMLALAAFNVLNRKSKDPNLWLGVFISRIVGGSALLISQLMTLTYSRDKKGWTLQYFTFSVVGSTLFLLANIIQTWKSSTYSTPSSSRGKADHLSKHILICAVLEFVVVFQMAAHIEQLSSGLFAKAPNYDLVHHDLGKLCGCAFMMMAVLTLSALNYEDSKARKSLMLIKMIWTLLMMLLDISLHYRFALYKKDMFIWELAQYVPFLVVTGSGYFHAAKHM